MVLASVQFRAGGAGVLSIVSGSLSTPPHEVEGPEKIVLVELENVPLLSVTRMKVVAQCTKAGIDGYHCCLVVSSGHLVRSVPPLS